MKKSDKIKPLGKLLLDLEKILLEMVDEHELQYGDILNLVYGYLEVHAPGAKEIYEDDGSSPEFYYGPRKSS